ncbi:MAG: DUF4115 domain-containing protein [Candidatus Omnitrophica bacterium]|nr:DUF4115 domain-containing protein [Candidatus Omnitrophota bacterium]
MAPATAQGTLLKSTRDARGISLRVVHEATKIPMDVLRAIEEGYTVRTLAPFYLKGFIKMYAEYLKINVQDIHIEERKQGRPAVSVSKSRVAPPTPSPVETLDLEQWFAGVFTHRRKQQIAILAVAFIAFFFLFKIITFFTHNRPKPVVKAQIKKEKPAVARSASVASATPEKKPQASTSGVKASETTAVAVKTSPKTTSAPVPSHQAERLPPRGEPLAAGGALGQASAPTAQLDREIMLTVRAKKDSWLRVEADGVTVFQSALTRGKSETWLAHDKIEISGKNMQQLEFELNGKLIGALSRRDYKAKKILITREGLSVVP